MKKHTLKKQERLKSRKVIEKLFAEGNTFTINPYRIFWLPLEEQDTPLKFAIGVPKKRFKNAVDRNLLKRRSREAYRTQKCDLEVSLQLNNMKISVFLVYINDTVVEYPVIHEQVQKIIHKLITSLNL